jgi:hypothetical protein
MKVTQTKSQVEGVAQNHVGKHQYHHQRQGGGHEHRQQLAISVNQFLKHVAIS